MSMHISNELKVIREVLSLTQEDLASIIGVSSDSVYRWENEKKEIEDNNIELMKALENDYKLLKNNLKKS